MATATGMRVEGKMGLEKNDSKPQASEEWETRRLGEKRAARIITWGREAGQQRQGNRGTGRDAGEPEALEVRNGGEEPRVRRSRQASTAQGPRLLPIHQHPHPDPHHPSTINHQPRPPTC